MFKFLVRGLALAGLGAVALAYNGTQQEVLAKADDILAAAADDACTAYCVACLTGPGHAAGNSIEGGGAPDAKEGPGWHTECEGANNCEEHACGDQLWGGGGNKELSAEELFAQVSDAVRRSDASAIEQLLTANPLRFYYVAERNAVQLAACNGDVVAHYPLTAAIVASLED